MFIGKLQDGAAVSRGRRPENFNREGREDEVRRLLSRWNPLVNFQRDRCLFRQAGIGTGGLPKRAIEVLKGDKSVHACSAQNNQRGS